MFIRANEGTSEKAASPSKLWREALGNSLLTYDNLSKSLHTFPLGFYPSLLSFKTSGLLWPLRKSSAFFILYPRCADSNPSNTCNKCHMSRAGTFPSYQCWGGERALTPGLLSQLFHLFLILLCILTLKSVGPLQQETHSRKKDLRLTHVLYKRYFFAVFSKLML